MIKAVIKFIILVLVILLIAWLYLADFGKKNPVEFGVTFSHKYAMELKLNWHRALEEILDDLGVRKFRLATHWDLLETEEGKYNFRDLDWQVETISDRGGEIILAIGQRTPRWPECHWPDWIFQYSEEERQEHILVLLEKIIDRYKDHPAIVAWQVENEPFLKVFGECPAPDKDFYEKEIALVKSLDSSRPIMVTESGELSTWLRGASLVDQVGTSVYRITWNKWLGYFYYPLPPAHYYLKAKLVKMLTPVEDIFVSEMQMEPWLGRPILFNSLEEQYESMDLGKFKDNLDYAERIGLSPSYLWGVEWWNWLKEQGEEDIWNEAKKIW